MLLSIRSPGTIHCVKLTSWGAGYGMGVGEAGALGGYATAYLQATEVEEIVAAVGELVHVAPFGYGVVRRYRVDDGVYEVELLGLPALLHSAASGKAAVKRKGSFRKESSTQQQQQQIQQQQQQASERERLATRYSIGMLYTTGSGMRRVDEEEQRSQRSCVVM